MSAWLGGPSNVPAIILVLLERVLAVRIARRCVGACMWDHHLWRVEGGIPVAPPLGQGVVHTMQEGGERELRQTNEGARATHM